MEDFMTHKPQVPPGNRNPREPGHETAERQVPDRKAPENLREQDRQGNIHQNTHNQGYQQDR
jgi:hypothetical protein